MISNVCSYLSQRNGKWVALGNDDNDDKSQNSGNTIPWPVVISEGIDWPCNCKAMLGVLLKQKEIKLLLAVHLNIDSSCLQDTCVLISDILGNALFNKFYFPANISYHLRIDLLCIGLLDLLAITAPAVTLPDFRVVRNVICRHPLLREGLSHMWTNADKGRG